MLVDAFCLSSTVLLMSEAAWDRFELLQCKEEKKSKKKTAEKTQ